MRTILKKFNCIILSTLLAFGGLTITNVNATETNSNDLSICADISDNSAVILHQEIEEIWFNSTTGEEITNIPYGIEPKGAFKITFTHNIINYEGGRVTYCVNMVASNPLVLIKGISNGNLTMESTIGSKKFTSRISNIVIVPFSSYFQCYDGTKFPMDDYVLVEWDYDVQLVNGSILGGNNRRGSAYVDIVR